MKRYRASFDGDSTFTIIDRFTTPETVIETIHVNDFLNVMFGVDYRETFRFYANQIADQYNKDFFKYTYELECFLLPYYLPDIHALMPNER